MGALKFFLLLLPSVFCQVEEFIDLCQLDEACVDYLQCGDDGVIITDGAGIINKRLGAVREECDLLQRTCCKIPGFEPPVDPPIDPPIDPLNQCFPEYDCVSFHQCDEEGKIVTDGAGIIMKRTGFFETCKLPSAEEGICCLKPGNAHPMLDQCFGTDTCTTIENCKTPYVHELGQLQPCIGAEGDTVCCIEENVVEPIPTIPGCGYNNSQVSTRISTAHGDDEAYFAEFPWQAIIFNQNYTFQCGAILISERFLLTAAHCVEKFAGNPGGIQIRLGDYQVDVFTEPYPYEDHQVANVYIHEKYNTRNNRNGIALIELAQPVAMKYHINSICLPSEPYSVYSPLINFENAYSHKCFATGWGQDAFQGRYQARMKKVELPILDHNHCQDLMRAHPRLNRFFRLDSGFMCAGGLPERDACKGDGGGPLSCWNPDSFRYELVGITSWGMGCGEYGVPGVYIDVYQFLPWIESTIKKSGYYNALEYSNFGK